MAESFAEQRLEPLRRAFVDCREAAFATALGDPGELKVLRKTWALDKFSPSRLRRRHSIGGFIPHFLASVLPPPKVEAEYRSGRDKQVSVWPDTDDELEPPHASAPDGGDLPERQPQKPSLPLPVGDDTLLAAGQRNARAADAANDQPTVTTLMLRNLPALLTQQDLATALDSSGFAGLYDFLYMPMCFESRENKGYAFVNFASPAAAAACAGSWHGSRRFAGVAARSPNGAAMSTLNISNALVQGFEANVQKWTRQGRMRDPTMQPFLPTPVGRTSGPDWSPTSRCTEPTAEAWAQQSRKPDPNVTPVLPVSLALPSGPDRSPTSCRSDPVGEAGSRRVTLASPLSTTAASPAVACDRFGVCAGDGQRQVPWMPGWSFPTPPTPASTPVNKELEDDITTLMVRNLPLGLTQPDFMRELDDSGFGDQYDFVYMPCCFEAKENKGYAFINFVSPVAAATFLRVWQRTRRFETGGGGGSSAASSGGVTPTSSLTITPAAVQGLRANTQKWSAPRMSRIRNPALRPFVRDDLCPNAGRASQPADGSPSGSPRSMLPVIGHQVAFAGAATLYSQCPSPVRSQHYPGDPWEYCLQQGQHMTQHLTLPLGALCAGFAPCTPFGMALTPLTKRSQDDGAFFHPHL